MERNLKSTDAAFQGMSLSQVAALGVFAGSAIALGLLGAALVYSIDQAGKMEQIFLKLQLSTQGTAAEFANMKDVLITTADASMFSLNDMGDAMYQMGLKGYTANDMAKYLIVSVKNLGEAIRTDPVSAAKLLGTTLREFQIPASQAAQTVDLLQYAFEHGVPSANKLETALARVGPMAVQMKMPLNEVVIALDTMAQNMNSSADVGGMLRYTLQSMYEPTTAQAKAQAELGLVTMSSTTPAFTAFEGALAATSKTNKDLVTGFDGTYAGMTSLYAAGVKVGTVPLSETFSDWVTKMGDVKSAFFDSSGHAKDFLGAMKQISEQLDKLPDNQKLAMLKQMFNVKSGQGAGVMLNEIDQMIAQYKKLEASHNNAGTAAMRAAQQEHSFNGSLAALKTSIQTTAGLLGGPLRDALTGMFLALNHALGPLVSFVARQPQIGAAFFAVAGAAALAGLIISAAFIPAIAPILMLSGIALGTVAAIIALGVAGAFIAANWNQVTAVFRQAVPGLQAVAVGLGLVAVIAASLRLGSLVTGFIDLAIAAGRTAIVFLTQVVPAMAASALAAARNAAAELMMSLTMDASLIPTLAALTVGWLVETAAMIAATLPIILVVALIAGMIVGFVLLIQHLGGLNMIMSVGKAIWASLASEFASVGNAIRGAFLSAIQQLGPVWGQLIVAFNQAKPALLVLGQIIGGLVVVSLGILIGLLHGTIAAVAQLIIAFIKIAAGIIQAFVGVIQFFTGFFTLLHGLFTMNGAEIQAGLRTMGAGIINIFVGLWTAVENVFVGAFNVIKGFVTGFISGIISFFVSLADQLVGHSIVPDMLKLMLQWFVQIFAQILGKITSFISSVINFFVNLGHSAVSAVSSAVSAIESAFSSGLNTVVSVVQGGISRVVSFFQNLGGMMSGAARSAWSAVTGAFNAGVGAVAGIAGSLGGRLMGVLGGLGGQMYSWGANAMSMFASGLASMIGAVLGPIQQAAAAIAGLMAHHSPAEKGPMAGDDKWMPNMMMMHADGIRKHIPTVAKAAADVALGIQSSLTLQSTQSVNANFTSGRPLVANLYVDGKQMAKTVINNFTHDLQMNGLSRSLL